MLKSFVLDPQIFSRGTLERSSTARLNLVALIGAIHLNGVALVPEDEEDRDRYFQEITSLTDQVKARPKLRPLKDMEWHVGHIVRHLRLSKGLTPEQLSAEAGSLRPQAFKTREETGSFSLPQLSRVARALGTTPEVLQTYTERYNGVGHEDDGEWEEDLCERIRSLLNEPGKYFATVAVQISSGSDIIEPRGLAELAKNGKADALICPPDRYRSIAGHRGLGHTRVKVLALDDYMLSDVERERMGYLDSREISNDPGRRLEVIGSYLKYARSLAVLDPRIGKDGNRRLDTVSSEGRQTIQGLRTIFLAWKRHSIYAGSPRLLFEIVGGVRYSSDQYINCVKAEIKRMLDDSADKGLEPELRFRFFHQGREREKKFRDRWLVTSNERPTDEAPATPQRYFQVSHNYGNFDARQITPPYTPFISPELLTNRTRVSRIRSDCTD